MSNSSSGVVKIVNTRFPPEPNGYLHVGHLKAMAIDFEKHTSDTEKCHCILRYDDTNPETETQEFADAIRSDVVDFFGYVPYKITYTSDYFSQLLKFAWLFIKTGLAYVDFSTQDEIKKQRGGGGIVDGKQVWNAPYASPFRDSIPADNMIHFDKMVNGEYTEKECCLRLKMDSLSQNPNMRDLVAYTIKHTPHFRTGRQYNVYPTYDFSHCIVDALEDIDFSYCTLEFVSRQESYYWVLDRLSELTMHPKIAPLKRPVVYEFSRFDVAGSVLSKRKIKSLIESGKLDGYDDPRLLTIAGLRRRGYTPESLKATVSQLGHTRNTTQLSIQLLENYIREDLNKNAPRAFGILDPLLVIIVDEHYDEHVINDYLNEFEDRKFERPIHPNDVTKGTRSVTLKKMFYIDRSDFESEAPKSYYRLTKTQPVRLKYTDGLIHYKHHFIDETNNVGLLYVTFTPDTTTKTKGCISWISKDDSTKVEYNSFGSLLTPHGDFNEESKKVCSGVFEHLPGEKGDRFQLERVGYYVIDSVNKSSITMNEIVGLRENK